MTNLITHAENLGVERGFYWPGQTSYPVKEFEKSRITGSERLEWTKAIKRARSQGASQRMAYEILRKLAHGVTLGPKDEKWKNDYKHKFADALEAYRSTT
jgi:hypothetical protein